MKSRNLPVFAPIITCTEQGNEFTIEMENDLVVLISPDGISAHPNKQNLKDCLEGNNRMRDYFYYKRLATPLVEELLPLMGAFPNTKKQIESYFENWN